MTNELKDRAPVEIGDICNCDGSLFVQVSSGQAQWMIDGYDSAGYKPIPEYLYDALMKFESEREQ